MSYSKSSKRESDGVELRQERERERERECVCVCVHADVEEEEECMKTRLACRVETAPIRASFKLTLSFTIKLEL